MDFAVAVGADTETRLRQDALEAFHRPRLVAQKIGGVGVFGGRVYVMKLKAGRLVLATHHARQSGLPLVELLAQRLLAVGDSTLRFLGVFLAIIPTLVFVFGFSVFPWHTNRRGESDPPIVSALRTIWF